MRTNSTQPGGFAQVTFRITQNNCWSHVNIENNWPASFEILSKSHIAVNPIQDGLFRGCSRMGGTLFGPTIPKICHTYPMQWWNLAQLYLTQIRSKKYMNHVTHPLSSADISIFSPKISKFCYIKKSTYILDFDTWFLFSLTLLESLVIVLINMVTILMISAKITTPGLLK